MNVSAASSSNIPIQLNSVLMPIDNNCQHQKASHGTKRKQISNFVDKVSDAEKAAIDN